MEAIDRVAAKGEMPIQVGIDNSSAVVQLCSTDEAALISPGIETIIGREIGPAVTNDAGFDFRLQFDTPITTACITGVHAANVDEVKLPYTLSDSDILCDKPCTQDE
eukprot:5710235-Prorocentrum_lima.AAC.1